MRLNAVREVWIIRYAALVGTIGLVVVHQVAADTLPLIARGNTRVAIEVKGGWVVEPIPVQASLCEEVGLPMHCAEAVEAIRTLAVWRLVVAEAVQRLAVSAMVIVQSLASARAVGSFI